MGFQFASKTKQTAQHKSSLPPKRTARPFAPLHPALQLQRSIGNQRVLYLLESQRIQPKCACGGSCPRCQQSLPVQPRLPTSDSAQFSRRSPLMQTQHAEIRQILDRPQLHTKLKTSGPDDRYEHEADRVADQVARMPDSQVQRQKEGEDSGPTQPATRDMPAASSSGGSGQPLPESVQSYFEPRFGHDFSKVKVHTDAGAAESAREINARAYTIGRDIVFGEGQYAPETVSGGRLLAHELTHVVQQASVLAHGRIQRKTLFGPAIGAPTDWKTKVDGASTSAEKAALVKEATGVETVDVTAKTKSDTKVNKAHLVAYNSSDPKINYDDGLNSKESISGKRKLTANAGYTINSAKSYVVLGPKALDADRYYHTRRVLSHEFDHIRQAAAGSKLKGNESELDAWTTSFIRDFHRSYVLRKTKSGSRCYFDSNPQWSPLLEYYVRSDVGETTRDDAIKRIKGYYTATIKPNAAHNLVFRYWIHRMMKKAGEKFDDLPVLLNKELKLGVDPAAKLSRRFECSAVAGVTYPKAPEVDRP